jgi:hypothetical protein
MEGPFVSQRCLHPYDPSGEGGNFNNG